MSENTGSPKIFNGRYTIHSARTGQHRTFEIKTIRRGNLKGKRVIGLLCGPVHDDSSSYTKFGFVTDQGIFVWRRFKDDSSYAKMAKMVWNMLTNPDHQLFKMGYTIEQSLNCVCCNRELTYPESIDKGYGPVCAKKNNLPYDHSRDRAHREVQRQAA